MFVGVFATRLFRCNLLLIKNLLSENTSQYEINVFSYYYYFPKVITWIKLLKAYSKKNYDFDFAMQYVCKLLIKTFFFNSIRNQLFK